MTAKNQMEKSTYTVGFNPLARFVFLCCAVFLGKTNSHNASFHTSVLYILRVHSFGLIWIRTSADSDPDKPKGMHPQTR